VSDNVLPLAALSLPSGGSASPAQVAERMAIQLVIVTAVRLFGESLVRALNGESTIDVLGVVQNLDGLRELLSGRTAQVALLDVTDGLDFDEVELLAADWPDLKLLALGLVEQRAEVIRCARAGFSGYITRDTPLTELVPLLSEVVRGGARCSGEIAAGLMKALFRPGRDLAPGVAGPSLTPREGEVLRLIGRGLSNKEIAREMVLSSATVKNHVHNLLGKLRLSRRSDAARSVREKPWIAGSALWGVLSKISCTGSLVSTILV
jgi:two-component system nitrate/nitrite response regulator NarL